MKNFRPKGNFPNGRLLRLFLLLTAKFKPDLFKNDTRPVSFFLLNFALKYEN